MDKRLYGEIILPEIPKETVSEPKKPKKAKKAKKTKKQVKKQTVRTSDELIAEIAAGNSKTKKKESRKRSASKLTMAELVGEKKPKKGTSKKNVSSRKNTQTSDLYNKEMAEVISRSSGKKNARKITSDATLRIIPLGGLEEIGKNMTLFECGEDAIIVDCGMSFPDDELLGIDCVIPDFSYLAEIKDKIRGLFLTHGHEDHIGGIPYLLKSYNMPIYGTPLTTGIVEYKLAEHMLSDVAKIHTVHTGDIVKAGCFSVEFIRVNHSIPDSAALAITTPAGVIIHTGDFKIDYTPVFGEPADLTRLSEYGKAGVLALLCDSTNAEKPGSSVTESMVGKSFESLFHRAEGKRVIIATFASNIYRIQQIIDFAENHGRKIAISGRSMVNYVSIAQELGYLKYKEETMIDVSEMSRFRDQDIVVITTGSQGEPMSALSRMASGNHKQIKITSNDCIIISANAIPGNEKSVTKVINSLLSMGSDVIYESMYDIHASGHACQNDIRLMLTLTDPMYFMPVHGEVKHLIKNANIGRQAGVRDDHIIISKIGEVVEFNHGKIKKNETVPSGRVFVDGFGVGDVGSVVLRDRQHLASDGLVVVVASIDNNTGSLISGPDIITRGFVYAKESEDLLEEAKQVAEEVIGCYEGTRRSRHSEKQELKDAISDLLYKKTKRNPMVLTVLMEI